MTDHAAPGWQLHAYAGFTAAEFHDSSGRHLEYVLAYQKDETGPTVHDSTVEKVVNLE
jgi:hypothetical protein